MGQEYLCQQCGSSTRDDMVRMCLWEGDRLIVIEDVPARICEQCAEQFYDDMIMYKVDKLRSTRFPLENAKRVMEVGVFSLASVEIPEQKEVQGAEASDERLQVDYSLLYESG